MPGNISRQPGFLESAEFLYTSWSQTLLTPTTEMILLGSTTCRMKAKMMTLPGSHLLHLQQQLPLQRQHHQLRLPQQIQGRGLPRSTALDSAGKECSRLVGKGHQQ